MRRSSMSTPPSELRASSAKLAITTLKSLSAWTDRTLADRLMADSYTLLQVFLDTLGLAEQERDVLVGRFGKPLHDLERLLELFDELVVLPVAPGLAQARQLTVQRGQLADHLVVELLETSREPT